MYQAHFLRYLPPKTNGPGEVLHVVSADDETFTLERYREGYPHLFEKPGFYSLGVATGQTFHNNPEKKK